MATLKSQKSKLIVVFVLFYYGILCYTNVKLGFDLLPHYPFLDALILIAISSFIYLFPSRHFSVFYLTFWMLLFSVLAITNTTMFHIFGDLFSTDYFMLVGEATQAFDWEFLNLWDFLFAIFIVVLFIMIAEHLLKQKPREKIKPQQRYMSFISFLLIAVTLFTISSRMIKKDIQINGQPFTERFYISALKKSAFNHYGMLSFYTKELKYHILNNFAIGYQDTTISDEQVQSDYYGLLEGKNVITILVESGQEMGVHPLLTPNLYRMREEGIYFSNNYSVNKSNVSEFIGFSGNFPSIHYSFINYQYDLPFTMPNLLNDRYITSYFHDNTYTFYQRSSMLPQVGFKHFYLHDELFPEPLPNWNDGWNWTGDYTPDSITIERILPHMIHTNQPFYSFWSTFSTHGPYSDNSRSNRDRFIEFGYFEQIEALEEQGLWENILDDSDAFHFKYYQAAMMDFDVALGRILEELEDNDLLDDTIIVLYGDHHAYYHDLHLRRNGYIGNEEELSEYVSHVDKLYDTILYMWNPELNQQVRRDYGTNEITTFTSPYVIVPTLLDLLGVPHKSDWYLNFSVFADEYIPVFYSHQLKALMNHQFYTVNLETIEYEATPATQEEQELFLFQALQILQRQSNIDELYLNRKPSI